MTPAPDRDTPWSWVEISDTDLGGTVIIFHG